MDVSRTTVSLFFLTFLAWPAQCQPFYFGVKGGVLLSPSKESSSESGRGGQTETTLLLRRYSIGPSAEIGLPWKLRLEAGLLYRSFDATRAITVAGAFRQTTWLSDNRWEAPLGIRRELSGGAARPFVGAGGVWSRFSRDVHVEGINFLPDPPSRLTGQWKESDDLFGWTGSAGVRFRLPMGLKITPELRYTRWTAKRWMPSQNQVDFFLGIGF